MTEQTPKTLDTIGKRLRHARERRGFRSRELAREAGLASESHVSLIEGGRPVDSIDVISKLADALHVSMDWLVNGGEMPDFSLIVPVELQNDDGTPRTKTGTDDVSSKGG